ncbi:methyl-accepting chemotaxis protein [Shewanella sp. GXUN23E]|uniref:methyl-accepting chemotaxis protein n=1 Tax=Shewanella sp. GXUN23E TaxID=3422498 RepID=UPI003D7C9939
MKEVKFRWIDKYLIHLSLKAKFTILTLLPAALFGLYALAQFHTHSQNTGLLLTHIAGGSASARILSADQLPSTALSSLAAANDTQPPIINEEGKPFLLVSLPEDKFKLLPLPEDLGKPNNLLIFMTIAAVLLILGVGYAIATFVGGALYTTVNALKRAAEGDLTGRLNFFEVKDEFSILAISIDTLVARQHQLVSQVHATASALRHTADSFEASAAEGHRLSNEQTEQLDSLACAMAQMAASVALVADNAATASNSTEEARQQAQLSEQQTQATVTTIDTLFAHIDDAASGVNGLRQSAERIDSIVASISSISEQTNLLALNAAIEAARAGNQGRGFAVVADEVRTLAAKAQAATVDIRNMITSVQQHVQILTQLMHKTVELAADGKSRIQTTEQDLTQIAKLSERVAQMSADIAGAANEQQCVSSNIESSLQDIRRHAQAAQTAATTNVSGARELHQTALMLEQLMQGLRIV